MTYTYIKRAVERRPCLYMLLIIMEILSLIFVFFVAGIIYRSYTVFESAKSDERRFDVYFENRQAEDPKDILANAIDSKTYVDNLPKLIDFITKELGYHIELLSADALYDMDGETYSISISDFSDKNKKGKIRYTYPNGCNDKHNNINNSRFNYKIGDSVNIGGKEFVIDEIYETEVFSTAFCFEYAGDAPDDAVVDRFLFQLKEKPTYNAAEAIKKKINELFKMPESISLPEGLELLDEQLNRSQMVVSVIMILFAAFNCSLFYHYIYITNSETLRIFRICGATSGKCRRLYFTEILLHGVISLASAYLLYEHLLKKAAIKFFPGIEPIYTPKTYGFIAVTYILLSLLVMFFCMSRFVDRPIAQKD